MSNDNENKEKEVKEAKEMALRMMESMRDGAVERLLHKLRVASVDFITSNVYKDVAKHTSAIINSTSTYDSDEKGIAKRCEIEEEVINILTVIAHRAESILDLCNHSIDLIRCASDAFLRHELAHKIFTGLKDKIVTEKDGEESIAEEFDVIDNSEAYARVVSSCLSRYHLNKDTFDYVYKHAMLEEDGFGTEDNVTTSNN